MKKENVVPTISMAIIFALIYALSLISVKPFEIANVKAFEDPKDPFNVFVFLVTLLSITAIVLFISKFWKKEIVYFFFLFAIAITATYALYPFLAYVLENTLAIPLATFISIFIVFLLIKRPEWYVIDACCTIISIGAITIFGLSLSIPLVILLLVILAVYDAIAVYKTKHMIDLADTVVEMKVPVLFVIPKRLPYSFIKERRLKEKKERDAFFIGVGDVVVPGILIVSTYHFTGELLISISTALGIIFSFFILMYLVSKGEAQPGLPFLNSGAVAGYVLSSLILHGNLSGFTLTPYHILCI